jgi:transposase
MAMRRLAMRKVREILRLKWNCKVSDRDVAKSCGIARSTVTDCVHRAVAAGLSWPLPTDVDDGALEARLYPPHPGARERALPEFTHIHREMSRRGVTLQLLWLEYRQQHGEAAYQYSQYTVLYREWEQKLDVVMRQSHRAGEKTFIDFAGQTLEITNAETGEVKEAQIFVATLGASTYTYAEALADQTIDSWSGAHVNMFTYFDGVTAVLVPDNLKAGVNKACFYEPETNPTYAELAGHYATAVIPARVRKPRDKSKVENGVLQVERWVLAPLRNHKFFSLSEANVAIRERLDWLNNRPLTNMGGATRKSLYEQIDKPALKSLPTSRFEISHWKCNVGVNIDYHVQLDGYYYSVPFQLVHQRVDIKSTAEAVECLFKGKRVALHRRRLDTPDKYVTDAAHRPKSHQRHAEWSPSRLISWGEKHGPATGEVVASIIKSRPHPEQGYRSCLGLMRLARRYSSKRLEAACVRACALKTFSYKSIESMLRTGMDKVPVQQPSAVTVLPKHRNIRGAAYYNKEESE